MSTKLFAVLLALTLASSPLPAHHAEYAKIADEVNNSEAPWIATTDFIDSLTEDDINSLFGTIEEPTDDVPALSYGALLDYFNAPTSFDARKQWPGRDWKINN